MYCLGSVGNFHRHEADDRIQKHTLSLPLVVSGRAFRAMLGILPFQRHWHSLESNLEHPHLLLVYAVHIIPIDRGSASKKA